MGYKNLLSDEKWKAKRMEIVERDNFTCTNCSNQLLIKNTVIFQGFRLSRLAYKKGRGYIPMARKNGNKYEELKSASFYIGLYPSNSRYELESEKMKYVLFYCDEKDLKNCENKIVGFIAARAIDEDVFLGKREDTQYDWICNKGLHVHHKYYKDGLLPWEYDNDALCTLCWECHEKLHKNTKIPYYDKNGNILNKVLTPCFRCYGAGWFPEYNHIENGICFKCNGVRYEEFIE